MSLTKLLKPKCASIILIFLVSLFAFWNINNIFFQQDEWLGLGGAISRSESGGFAKVFSEVFSFNSGVTRFLPLTSITNYIVYNAVGLNISLYGILAFVLAFVNALLVNLVAQKLTKSFLLSTATALFWITNNLSYQSITWISPVVPSQSSFLFLMLGFYFFIRYITQHIQSRNNLILATLFFTVSLLFKEGGLFYIIIVPLLLWVYPRFKSSFKEKSRITAFLFIPILIAVILPHLILASKQGPTASLGEGSATRKNIVYNTFLLPARVVFHVFLPQKQIYEFIYSANKIHYNAPGEAVEAVVGDAFSLLASFYVLLLISIVLLISRNQDRKMIQFSLIGLFASTAPFIVYINWDVVLQPRFYIFPAFWGGLLLTSLVGGVTRSIAPLRTLLIIIIFIPLIIYNSLGIRQALATDIKVGQYRKDMLEQLSELKPQLHKDNIFYFFTDNTGFYEFQSGFGQTLAVWLYDTKKIPRQALTDTDFMNFYYEGLKDYNGSKYGYFMTYSKLLDALKNNPDIDINVVHAYYWDHPKHKIKNVSQEIRQKLEQDLKR